MTDTHPHDQLEKIGFHVSNCAGAALGIDLISFACNGNAENRSVAISAIASVLERELERIAEELGDWVRADAKRQSGEGS